MTHVVAEPCLGCKHTTCVDVCPAECFHEDALMLYINPDTCIDCESCVSECPEQAIFHADNLPAKWAHYLQLNAEKCKILPVITEMKEPLKGSGG